MAAKLPAFTCPHCDNSSYGREITRHVARSWLYPSCVIAAIKADGFKAALLP